jgi:hypothetical protein
VTVDLIQAGLGNDWEDSRLIDASAPSEKLDSDRIVWHVQVPANGSATVTATFDTRY